MLHIENEFIKKYILDGNFGLEKESLRIFEDGTFAHTLHPFPEDRHIVKDFCENQTEINTSVHVSIEETLEELEFHNQRICQKLWSLPEKEYLWLFSNPPYIENERDIPVAVFEGREVSKTAYRDYLSHKYGRYKMTFSGIHVNFSFSDELLLAGFAEGQKRAGIFLQVWRPSGAARWDTGMNLRRSLITAVSMRMQTIFKNMLTEAF